MKSEVSDIKEEFQISLLEWHLVKKKISNRINVERPDEEILIRYRDITHDPLPNYADDHILNTVSSINP